MEIRHQLSSPAALLLVKEHPHPLNRRMAQGPFWIISRMDPAIAPNKNHFSARLQTAKRDNYLRHDCPPDGPDGASRVSLDGFS